MSLLGRFRRLYLDRASAVIEVDRTTLYIREGELFLDRADLAVADILRAFGEGGAAVGPSLRHRVAALARTLAGHRSREREWKPRGAIELVGPLPTVYLLMELAVHGCGERELLNRVGGPQAVFCTDPASPAMEQMAGLEPEMTQVLATLTEPMAAQSIIRGVTLDRFGALQGLARLWAVGLVVHHEAEAELESSAAVPMVRPRILQRLHESVAESLAAQPLNRRPAEHRETVASLWQAQGELDYYQLLGLDRRAENDDNAIHKGFAQMARQVHPSHAERLDLADKDEMLRVLFERAVHAYWTLNNPSRRIAYNRTLDAPPPQVDEQQRDIEKRELARDCYRQGTQLLAANDVSAAIDALREAVRMDRRADYFSLLGQAEARNPAWTDRAINNFRQAIQLDPNDVRARMGLGAAYEEQENEAAAVEHYRAALAAMPDNPEARIALQRLGEHAPSSRTTGRLRSFFTGTENST